MGYLKYLYCVMAKTISDGPTEKLLDYQPKPCLKEVHILFLYGRHTIGSLDFLLVPKCKE